MANVTDQDVFAVATYLAACAPLTYEESNSLNAFRLIDAASRLMRLTDDEFLHARHAEFEANSNLVMADEDAFRAWLSDYARTFTAEALRRNRQEPDTETKLTVSN